MSADPEKEAEAALASVMFEHAVMGDVLDDLDLAVRTGGLAGSPFAVGFVWAQNQDALLAGETTWEAQYGPHRHPDRALGSEAEAAGASSPATESEAPHVGK